MVAPEVQLIREDDRELFFAHRPLTGVFFMLVGLCMVYFFSVSPLVKETTARWIFGAGGTLFALIGLGAAVWRYELHLDLVNRSYRGRKGFWPVPGTIRGSLDELEGVALTSRVERNDGSTTTVWSVGLSFRTWQKPVVIMESQSEVKAYEAVKEYSKKLQIPALDRTGGLDLSTHWSALDMPLREQPGHPMFIPPLPSESRIEFIHRPGKRIILLPASGASFEGFFLILFGTPFFAGGAMVLVLLLFGDPQRVHGSVWVGWMVGIVFMVAGAGIMFLAVAGMWGRPLIEEEGAALTYTLKLFGKHIRPQRLLKRDVEEVAIKQGPSKRHELVLRSNRKIVRMQGWEQNPQELEWLRIAVSVIVSG